ncbi:MAG TPA: carboxypeptidase-like regulatory domain-containing protein [Terriglobia bacterium]|nr:carboxypeptidase-like regulatory domain-containing protein [Terriglobia bacterium]
MFALLLSMALLLAPQANPANPQIPVPPQQKCTVSGSVLSAATGQPLRDASVSLRKAGVSSTPLETMTGADGRFEINNVDPARYYLFVSKAGYVSLEYGQKSPDDPLRLLALAPGQSIRDISFQLIRGAVITGYVYNEDGEPIENMQVRAERYRYYKGKRRLMPTGYGQTDDRGKYRIFDLAPGDYYISASAEPMSYGGSASYERTYYPGVADPTQSSPLGIRAGDEFPDVDVTLHRVGVFHVRGRVTNGIANASLTSARVFLDTTLEPWEEFGAAGTIRDASGDFDVEGVRPGTYDLIAQFSYKGTEYQARQKVTLTDSDVNGIRLVLTPGATLKGDIQTEGSVDLSKARVELRPPSGMFFGTSNMSPVAPDGTVEFDAMPDGHYLAEVDGLSQNAYVKSVTLGDEDVLDSGFDIANGQAPGTSLKIVVSANGAQIGGTVMLDGKPFNDALVTLLPADFSKLSDDLWFKTATTDQYGNYSLTGIRPGDYLLFGWEKIESGRERDPDFISQFKDQGQQVHMGPGAALNFQLKALPASEIHAAEGQ